MRISDWSSDVCSSDLSFRWWSGQPPGKSYGKQANDRHNVVRYNGGLARFSCTDKAPCNDAGRLYRTMRFTCRACLHPPRVDRKRVVTGKRGSVRVDLGGRRFIQKKKTTNNKRR